MDDPKLLKRRFTNIVGTCFAGDNDEQTSAYSGWKSEHTIPGEHFTVASLPARLPRELRIVRIYHQFNECLAVVDDIGPWNVRDRYWETEDARPMVETQYLEKCECQNGHVPSNRAGIDLSPEIFREFGVKPKVGTMIVDWQFETDPVIMKYMWEKYDAVLKKFA